jgi:hypothetical protein
MHGVMEISYPFHPSGWIVGFSLLAGGAQLAGGLRGRAADNMRVVRVAAETAKRWRTHAGRRLRPQIRLRRTRTRGGQSQPAPPASLTNILLIMSRRSFAMRRNKLAVRSASVSQQQLQGVMLSP